MREPALHFDWETFSACNLKKAGLAAYQEHPTTGCWIASYAFDDEPVQTWFCRREEPPPRVVAHIKAGLPVWAHNAPFEVALSHVANRLHDFPILRPEQMICTMAMAHAMAIPASLEKAAAAMGIDQQKDMKGHRHMMKMAQPKSINDPYGATWYTWHETDEDYRLLAAYGAQDIVVERLLGKRLMPLMESEFQLWLLDQKINQRGFLVDIKAIEKSMAIVEAEKARLNDEMKRVTENVVGTCSAVGQFKDWLGFMGVKTDGVAKADVLALLEDPGIPAKVREALLLRQQAAKSSTAKLEAMLLRANSDGRVRATMQFHGAGTGRWAGRGIQPHNFPRGKYSEAATKDIFDAITNFQSAAEYISLCYGPPLQVLSNLLRSYIVAKMGCKLVFSDYNAIEARVLAWLAGEEGVLDVFRRGGDIYVYTYSKAFGIPESEVDDDKRQIGKVMVLALGYQGGKGAFQVMAKAYNVKVSDSEADRIKEFFRAANSRIVQYWHQVERQAILAVKNPGTKFMAGAKGREVCYRKVGSFLFCRLPSGRVLSYPYPKIVQKETPWGETRDSLTYMAEDSMTKKWERQDAYGGLLVENITQAVARDVLAHGLTNCEKAKLNPVFHVHDEIVCEVPEADVTAKRGVEIAMEDLPTWAAGLPIKAKAAEGKRYRK